MWRPGASYGDFPQVFTLEYQETKVTHSDYTIYKDIIQQRPKPDVTVNACVTGLDPGTQYTFRLTAIINQTWFTRSIYQYITTATTGK